MRRKYLLKLIFLEKFIIFLLKIVFVIFLAKMTMYERARTVVRTKQGYSTEFEVKVGVHQGSVLSPLLFVAMMEVVTQGVKEGLPWELLYTDDLVLVAQSKRN